MKPDEFLAVPENRKYVRSISQQVLFEVYPDQRSSVGFIDPLMDMYAKGETATVSSSDKAGGFGGTDLMIMVVVPITVTVLSNLLTEWGKKKIGEPAGSDSVKNISGDSIQTIARKIKPSITEKEITRLTNAVEQAIKKHLEQ